MNLIYFNPHYKVKNRVYFSSFNFLAGGIKFMIKRRIIVNVSILFILVGCIIIVPRLFGMIGSKSLSGTPTVFVHGYKGTFNSFANMLKRFEDDHKWGEKVLVYRVSKKGKINVTRSGDMDAEQTYVQVVFEDNRASFEDTSGWLSQVLAHLKKEYNVESVNLVGHSMGGVVALKYIEDYQDEKKYPQNKKLITLGSPFDGIYSEEYFRLHRDAAAMDLMPESAALDLLRSNKDVFPENIKVLNIGSTGDLIAVPKSVKSLSDIVPREKIKEMIIESEKLGHSALHENEQIDKLVHEFLYNK